MHWIDQIFGAEAPISPTQEIARAILIFAYGLLLLRLSGRRTFGRWSALDVVVSIIVGSSLSRVLTGNAPLIGTLVGVAVLVAFHWLLAQGAARSPAISLLVEGLPIELGVAGHVEMRKTRRHGISDADLAEAARRAGLRNPSEASVVVLEPNGTINMLR